MRCPAHIGHRSITSPGSLPVSISFNDFMPQAADEPLSPEHVPNMIGAAPRSATSNRHPSSSARCPLRALMPSARQRYSACSTVMPEQPGSASLGGGYFFNMAPMSRNRGWSPRLSVPCCEEKERLAATSARYAVFSTVRTLVKPSPHSLIATSRDR